MSGEEDSMSEGFSASEDEWKPTKNIKGGESSDDDDSDFEAPAVAGAQGGAAIDGSGTSAGRKRGEQPKARSAAKQTASKKRTGISLRAKLYNKYRPPPKTFSPPGSVALGKNSPSASTSRTNSKNATAPNESKSIRHKNNRGDNNDDDGNDSDSSSGSSIDNYLVHPKDLDIQSSFFNVDARPAKKPSVSPVPVFDCNAGLGNLTDSESDNDKETESHTNTKAFDFKQLLDYANNLEQVKENLKQVAKESAAEPGKKSSTNIDTLDVYAVLALGEKLQNRSHNDGEDEDDEDDEDGRDKEHHRNKAPPPSKLSKTKSTRIKRHTKTRPTSTVAADDTDDSEWEEVADTSETADSSVTANDMSQTGNLEIHVELPSGHREKKTKTQQDLEMALKRKLNRDIKDRQLLLHKASLLCHFGRTFFYNRLLNDTVLMQKTLKLLPSKNAYPPERGTEIKYYQSLMTWFKSAIKLKTQNLYPEKSTSKTKAKTRKELLKQIDVKEARSKQDMIFIFIILLRGMGLQCRLIVNMQPLPMKPAQTDLLTIKMKNNDDKKDKKSSKTSKKINIDEQDSDKADSKHKATSSSSTSSSRVKLAKQDKVQKLEEPKKDKIEIASTSKKTDSKSAVVLNKKDTKAKPLNKQQETTVENKIEKEKPLKISTTNKAKLVCVGVDEVKNYEEKPKGPSVMKTIKLVEKEQQIDKSKRLEEKSKTDSKVSTTTKKDSAHKEKPQSVAKTAKNATEKKSQKPEETEKTSKTKVEKTKTITTDKSSTTSVTEVPIVRAQQQNKEIEETHHTLTENRKEELENSQKENTTKSLNKPTLARLKRTKAMDDDDKNNSEHNSKKKPTIEAGSPVIPKIVVQTGKEQPSTSKQIRITRSRSRSKSPQPAHISAAFLLHSQQYKDKFPGIIQKDQNIKPKQAAHRAKSPLNKVKISTDFLKNPPTTDIQRRVLRSRQKPNETAQEDDTKSLQIPQIDGADDDDYAIDDDDKPLKSRQIKKKRLNIQKLKVKRSTEDSDEYFEPSPPKKPKTAPAKTKPDRRVLSSDDEQNISESPDKATRKPTAGDMWVEVWSDVEEQWICIDLFKGKVHCVDTIRKSASPNLAYVFAFQNDLSLKDVTARYCPNWTTTVRKSRVEKAWLDTAISQYLGHRTKRDIKEDQELRKIHEQKPMPTTIGDYKNHPFYALERHLLKFEALYPPQAPPLGYIRGEAVYSRDCVHSLHSREIWLKQARTVKLGEKPYKIVKARPKWDRITQTVIKDQPLEIFGYWQTQDYEPPTAENGLVPRNAYGNVELFKACMLPKKTVHLRLPGLNRICRKLNIDCANAVVGFDFHQGSCHPTYDGFIVCEEFHDQVVAAWYQDQEDQERKETEKYEARVYGNWKKLIRGLLIRERLKLKYNF